MITEVRWSEGSAPSPGTCLKQLTLGLEDSLQGVMRQEEVALEAAEIRLPGLATPD